MSLDSADAPSPPAPETAEAFARLPRVLAIVHAHPRLSRGGSEISADALVKGMREEFGVPAWLLGCSDAEQVGRLGVQITQPFGPNDYVYNTLGSFNWFHFANRDVKFPEAFAELLLELRPDVVHFHHYAQVGVEALAIVRRTLPHAKIVLTLHEYLAICNSHGQMVKAKTLELCRESGFVDCSLCFPSSSPRDFFLRKLYVQTFLNQADIFIAPSRFLARRYVEWGLDAKKFRIIENVTAAKVESAKPTSPVRADEARRRRVRIAFFGQMSRLKGIGVLLEAARLLAKRQVEGVSIELYGSSANQPPEFQNWVTEALKLAGDTLVYRGPYENSQVYHLMSQVDAVVVPSIWWENSPVVIEEALAAGKPVLCSNIGGMAEKVRHGVDGFNFEVNDPNGLADLIADIAADPSLLDSFSTTARRPPPPRVTLISHLKLYMSLFAPAGNSA